MQGAFPELMLNASHNLNKTYIYFCRFLFLTFIKFLYIQVFFNILN